MAKNLLSHIERHVALDTAPHTGADPNQQAHHDAVLRRKVHAQDNAQHALDAKATKAARAKANRAKDHVEHDLYMAMSDEEKTKIQEAHRIQFVHKLEAKYPTDWEQKLAVHDNKKRMQYEKRQRARELETEYQESRDSDHEKAVMDRMSQFPRPKDVNGVAYQTQFRGVPSAYEIN